MATDSNPYSSPNAAPEESADVRRPSRILLIPAAFFFLMGVGMVIGPAVSFVLELANFQNASLARLAGYPIFVVAGVLWIFAARSWRNARWWSAVAYTAVGWLLGGTANNLIG